MTLNRTAANADVNNDFLIYALASGRGAGGVAIIRISGARAIDVATRLSNRASLEPRHAHYARLRDPASGMPLDDGLVIAFPAPHSFTGEDMAELHVHGGRAVIDAVFRVLQHEGAVLAAPGAFTKRAFLNGKMDLTQAEAINDLIQAETETQRRQALFQASGALGDLYQSWTDKLKAALAHQEADIEFPDEGMPDGVADTVKQEINALLLDITRHLSDGFRGEILRSGIRIAIIGKPNAGKSSLLNALAKREAAIVSDIAGTTRDVIDVHMDISGYGVILCDTAGLRLDATDAIEKIGVERAIVAAETAALRIALFDATKPFDPDTLSLIDDNTIVVVNKTDIGFGINAEVVPGRETLFISVKQNKGIDALLNALALRLHGMFDGVIETPMLTQSRHRDHLNRTVDYLHRALDAILPELAAEDMRQGLKELGAITGRIHVEDILDVVFRDFCIGK